MAEAKGKGQAPARRRKPPKASAAFGRLNQLSASGALSKINHDDSTSTPEDVSVSAEPAPNTTSDETTARAAAAAADPIETSAAPAQSTAASKRELDEVDAHVSEQARDSSTVPASGNSSSEPTPSETAAKAAAAPPPVGDLGVRAEQSIPAQAEAQAEPVSLSANPSNTTLQILGQQPRAEQHGQHGPSPSVGEVAVRRASGPAFPAASGYSEQRMLEALPPQLAEKVQGLPVAYLELAKSYRQAQATRTGTKPAKRNIRLHSDVATAVNRQMVSDKRMLGLRNLKPSQYVDAAITLARHVSVDDLIRAADHFRDSHLGEEAGSATPNHYSISRENDAWLDNMMDELLLANTTGLHGHMINVIVQSFLEQLKEEAPAPAS
ncbi:hypothetical protein KBZ00_17210 [Streptomyces sp. RK31]|uniref:hypothetical protein n=1 Tax=Streptomyces sp. RK31 TaxID=2824892 RepID=UPI001B37451D|nr:hypothetical protein [Streptomyces sp. RK31]MBQ0972864.1 hypothetical protein [Streptomyces sp. RK31]